MSDINKEELFNSIKSSFDAESREDLVKYFTFRGGFNSISEEFTVGFGLSIYKCSLDYGFGLQTDLGNTHRLGLTYKFGN